MRCIEGGSKPQQSLPTKQFIFNFENLPWIKRGGEGRYNSVLKILGTAGAKVHSEDTRYIQRRHFAL